MPHAAAQSRGAARVQQVSCTVCRHGDAPRQSEGPDAHPNAPRSRLRMRERARDTRMLALSLAIAIVAVGAGRPAPKRIVSTAQWTEPAHVAITGTDYAFVQLPSTLPAGPTLFSFENRGTKRHEMSIALLR